MGFNTGLGFPTSLGRPYYYMKDGGVPINQWNPNTFLNFTFDSSGSMNSIITPLVNCVDCAYCASGSAAGGDCVKSTNCLRADLQDYYATGGVEGAPDYNSNTATNGKDEYEAHVGYRIIDNERYMTWFYLHYPARSVASVGNGLAGKQTWNTLAGAKTIDNIIQVTVANESKPPQSDPNDKYHRSQFGSPHTESVTAEVNGATTNSTQFTSTTDYDNEDEELTGLSNTGGNNTYIMSLTARSSGGTITAGTKIMATSGTTVTLNNAHSFVDGETLTFSVTNPGWDNTEIMNEYNIDVNDLRQSVSNTSVNYSNGIHGALYAPGDGISGVLPQTPSINWVHIDAGLTVNSIVTGLPGSTPPYGPKADPANQINTNFTASQRLLNEGVHLGLGVFGSDPADSGANKSLNDWNDLISPWNNKNNTFLPISLIGQAANTSQAYWYGQLKAALDSFITI